MQNLERLEGIIQSIGELDQDLMQKAQDRLNNLTKPRGSLGRLEGLAVQLIGITSRPQPLLARKLVIVIAADHGVAKEGVSLFPQEVTAQMVLNFLQGGAAINVLARHAGCMVKVVDIGVKGSIPDPAGRLLVNKIAPGSGNIARGPAMTPQQAIKAILFGASILEREKRSSGVDIVATGDMGIANTTPSSAVISVITGAPVEQVTGRGTGVDEQGYAKKIEVIKRAIQLNRPDPGDPLGVLAKVGGLEIAGLVGVILAGCAARIPVVIDGFISAAAAIIAFKLQPRVAPYLIAAHRSAEPGHMLALQYMGLKPVLDLDMRLGEGTGAVLSMHIIEASLKIYQEMATFDDAGVSREIG